MSVGKLRLRDGELVVEGMAGEILAKVEPDPDMQVSRVDLGTFFGGEGPTLVEIRWQQPAGDRPAYIDVDATDVVDEEVPQLP